MANKYGWKITKSPIFTQVIIKTGNVTDMAHTYIKMATGMKAISKITRGAKMAFKFGRMGQYMREISTKTCKMVRV